MALKEYTGEVVPDGEEPPAGELKPYSGEVVADTPNATVGDVVKEVGASAVESLGSIAQFGGELVSQGVNAITGEDTLRAVNPLGPIAEYARESMTPGGQAARRDTFKGDILQPFTGKGEAPALPETGSGLAMGLAQGVGSLAATVGPLAVAKAAKVGKAALTTLGAVAGGAMTGGSAAEQTRQSVRKVFAETPHEKLLESVPAYREEIERGLAPEAAKSKVENRSALYSNLLSAAFGAAGGGINARFLDDIIARKGIALLLGKVSEKGAVRAAAGAAAGGFGEGLQEVSEQVGQSVGENVGLGRPATQDATRDTFGPAVLGAAIGAPVGGVAGAVTPAAAPAAPGAPPVPPGIDPETGEILSGTPGISAEQEEIALRRMEKQAMVDQYRARQREPGEDESELEALTEIRGELNQVRAENSLPPVPLAEWKSIVDGMLKLETATEQKPAFPFITPEAAGRYAEQMQKKTGRVFAVSPHPTVQGRFAVHPEGEPPVAPKTQPSAAKNAFKKPAPASQAGGGEQGPPVGQKDRRVDMERRALTDEMSPEQMRKELLTNPVSGIANKRSWDEKEQRGELYRYKSSIDLDDFKGLNDKFGHAAGDRVLRTVGQVLKEALGPDAHHLSGDEFAAHGEEEAGFRAALDGVQDRLSRVELVFKTPDGREVVHKGIGFSYGVADDLETADFNLQADKRARKAAGLRTGARDQPGPTVEAAAPGDATGGREGAERIAPSEDERLAAKRAIYQAHKATGAPDDVAANAVTRAQEKANESGAPMTVWRGPSGTLGTVPASAPSPFKGGEKIATIHPEAGAQPEQKAGIPDKSQQNAAETDLEAAFDQAAAEARAEKEPAKEPPKLTKEEDDRAWKKELADRAERHKEWLEENEEKHPGFTQHYNALEKANPGRTPSELKRFALENLRDEDKKDADAGYSPAARKIRARARAAQPDKQGNKPNESGVYEKSEDITLPDATHPKTATPSARVRLVELADGTWTKGVDAMMAQSGTGYAPSMDSDIYISREDALRDGLREIREFVTGKQAKEGPNVKSAARIVKWLDAQEEALDPPPPPRKKGEKTSYELRQEAAAKAQPDAKGRKPEHGVYQPTATPLIMPDPRPGHTGAGVKVAFTELADGKWIYSLSVDFATGGSSDQLSFDHPQFDSREAAISDAMRRVRLAAERTLQTKKGQDALIAKAMQKWQDGFAFPKTGEPPKTPPISDAGPFADLDPRKKVEQRRSRAGFMDELTRAGFSEQQANEIADLNDQLPPGISLMRSQMGGVHVQREFEVGAGGGMSSMNFKAADWPRVRQSIIDSVRQSLKTMGPVKAATERLTQQEQAMRDRNNAASSLERAKKKAEAAGATNLVDALERAIEAVKSTNPGSMRPGQGEDLAERIDTLIEQAQKDPAKKFDLVKYNVTAEQARSRAHAKEREATRRLFQDNAFQAIALRCPTCDANPGARCKRPSGHEASDLHKARKDLADEWFVDIYGEAAVIDYDEKLGRWVVRDKKGGKVIDQATNAGRAADGDTTVDEEAKEAATNPENDKTPPTPAQQEAGNYPKGHTEVAGLPISIENPEGSVRYKYDVKRIEKLREIVSGLNPENVTDRKSASNAAQWLRRTLDALEEGNPAKAVERMEEAERNLRGQWPVMADTIDSIIERGWHVKMPYHYGYFLKTQSTDGEGVDVAIKPGTSKGYKGPVYVLAQNKDGGTYDEPKVFIGWHSQEQARAAYISSYSDPAKAEQRIRGIRTFNLTGFKTWVYDPQLTVRSPIGEQKQPPKPPAKEPPKAPTLDLFDALGEPTAEATKKAPELSPQQRRERALNFLHDSLLRYVERGRGPDEFFKGSETLSTDGGSYAFRGGKVEVQTAGDEATFVFTKAQIEEAWEGWVESAKASGNYRTQKEIAAEENREAATKFKPGEVVRSPQAILDLTDGGTVYASGQPLRVVSITPERAVLEVYAPKDGDWQLVEVAMEPRFVHVAHGPTNFGPPAGSNAFYKQYEGRQVTITRQLEGGEKATLTMRGDEALRDLDQRIAAVEDLARCLA